MGRWLAREAARAGYRVLLEDVMPARLRQAREYLDENPQSVEPTSVELVSSIEDAVREADFAIDCVPDELESKLEIFCLLDRMAPPRTMLCTPTTRLSIADLASCTYRPDRCVAVAADARELAGPGERELTLRVTRQTAAETTELVTGFWQRVGFRVAIKLDTSE